MMAWIHNDPVSFVICWGVIGAGTIVTGYEVARWFRGPR